MIAEAFNDFFMSIGPKLSAEINHDALDLSENLSTSPVTLFTLSEANTKYFFCYCRSNRSVPQILIQCITSG